jgi:putative aminopeptidase FrvX
MVSKDVGDELLDGMNSDMKLRVDFDVTVEKRDTWVVTGDVKGTDNPKKFVMFGAHHDTVYNGVGAVDNTVGTVTVIELARQLAKYNPKRTIRLATWGGEEEGLYGSVIWTNRHKEDVIDNCMMYFNFDMNNVDLKRGNEMTFTVSDNSSVKHVQSITNQLGRESYELDKYDISVVYYDLSKIGSDHLAFTRFDVRAASAWGSGSLEYHTYLDTIEHVNVESLSISGRILGSYGLYLANK